MELLKVDNPISRTEGGLMNGLLETFLVFCGIGYAIYWFRKPQPPEHICEVRGWDNRCKICNRKFQLRDPNNPDGTDYGKYLYKLCPKCSFTVKGPLKECPVYP